MVRKAYNLDIAKGTFCQWCGSYQVKLKRELCDNG